MNHGLDFIDSRSFPIRLAILKDLQPQGMVHPRVKARNTGFNTDASSGKDILTLVYF
jgi:hypothetical protein